MVRKSLILDGSGNPLTPLETLHAGDIVELSGHFYTARDAAHKRLTSSTTAVKLVSVYYCGPSPARKGEVIGSCGPTSSIRMDCYTPLLLERGLRVMIGKGERSQEIRRKIADYGAIYLLAIGGAAVYIKRFITSCETVAYADLGAEAIFKLRAEKLPLIVGIDSAGNSVFDRQQPNK